MMGWRALLATFVAAWSWPGEAQRAPRGATRAPAGGAGRLAPAVVLVTLFEGEYTRWRERLPLAEELPFPSGALGIPLGWNSSLRVLGIVTGMGSKNTALSITALGHDLRFDLSAARWVVCGIAGADPRTATIGSAAWARYLVDGNMVQSIDPRESPPGWSTGMYPPNRAEPYGAPAPSEAERKGVVYRLSEELVQWAFGLTSGIAPADSAEARATRLPYAHGFPVAGRPPAVLRGDGMATDAWYHGELSTQWARNWTAYWTSGEALFAHWAMEDVAVAAALDRLAAAGRATPPSEGLLVLRAMSNFVMPPPGGAPGVDPEPFLQDVAFESAWAVGSPAVLALARRADHRDAAALAV